MQLCRQLAEHLAVYNLLAVAEQDRDLVVADHRALLDTLNSAILGTQSYAVPLIRPPEMLRRWDRPLILLSERRDHMSVRPDRDRLLRLPSANVFNRDQGPAIIPKSQSAPN